MQGVPYLLFYFLNSSDSILKFIKYLHTHDLIQYLLRWFGRTGVRHQKYRYTYLHLRNTRLINNHDNYFCFLYFWGHTGRNRSPHAAQNWGGEIASIRAGKTMLCQGLKPGIPQVRHALLSYLLYPKTNF